MNDKAAAPRKQSEAATDSARTNAAPDVCLSVYATFGACRVLLPRLNIYKMWDARLLKLW